MFVRMYVCNRQLVKSVCKHVLYVCIYVGIYVRVTGFICMNVCVYVCLRLCVSVNIYSPRQSARLLSVSILMYVLTHARL